MQIPSVTSSMLFERNHLAILPEQGSDMHTYLSLLGYWEKLQGTIPVHLPSFARCMLCPIDEEEEENKRKKGTGQSLEQISSPHHASNRSRLPSLFLSRSLSRTRRFPTSVTKDKCLFSPFKLSEKTTSKSFVFVDHRMTEKNPASTDDDRII